MLVQLIQPRNWCCVHGFTPWSPSDETLQMTRRKQAATLDSRGVVWDSKGQQGFWLVACPENGGIFIEAMEGPSWWRALEMRGKLPSDQQGC